MGPGQREQFVEIDAVDILKLRYRERPRPRLPGGCRADNRNGEQNNGHRSGDRGFSRQCITPDFLVSNLNIIKPPSREQDVFVPDRLPRFTRDAPLMPES